MRHLRSRLAADREIPRQLSVALEDETNQLGTRITDAAIDQMSPFACRDDIVSSGFERDRFSEAATRKVEDTLNEFEFPACAPLPKRWRYNTANQMVVRYDAD